MKSAFDVGEQLVNKDHKIVAALERISEAFRVLLWDETKKTGLSPIQIQILIFLNYHPQKPHTPSDLANEFNVTKATITDSIRVLEKKGLLDKKQDAKDARSYHLQLTTAGTDVAKTTSSFADHLTRSLKNLDPIIKGPLLEGLIKIISTLNQESIITMPRMCRNCRFLETQEAHYFCQFLKRPLETEELRIDCPEFEAKD